MSNVTVKGTPKDVFSYLGWLVTLYIGLSSFVWLLFEFIERALPEATDYLSLSSMRWLVAELVILFPIFLVISWSLRKDIAENPEKLNTRVRKWFLSLTLFLVSCIAVGDLTYLLYNFLDGELGIRYVLKSLTILLVCSSVFLYYLWDLKGLLVNSSKPKFVAGFISLVVMASVGFGFYTVGTPWQQRARKLDRERIADLEQIEIVLQAYYRQNSTLPAELSELKDFSNFQYTPIPLDPETQESYEYRILNSMPVYFELCANFETEPVTDYSKYGSPPRWNYEPGRNCFKSKLEQNNNAP